MKKYIYIAITMCCLFFLIGCGNTKGKSKKELQEFRVYVEVKFEENLFFDKYGVEVYIDDEKIESLKHGQSFSATVKLKEGKHKIKILKKSNHDIKGTKSFTIAKDSSLYMKIETDSNDIDIKKYNFVESLEGNLIIIQNVKGKVLTEAINELENAGFKKVSYESNNDKKIKNTDNWIVIEQNYENVELDKNEKIILVCEKPEIETESTIIEETVIEETTTVQETVVYKYDFAFERVMKNYTLYYLFDEDTKEVVYFGTQSSPMIGNYSGDFSSGVSMYWPSAECYDTFKWDGTSNVAYYVGNSDYDVEFKKTSVEKVEEMYNNYK